MLAVQSVCLPIPRKGAQSAAATRLWCLADKSVRLIFQTAQPNMRNNVMRKCIATHMWWVFARTHAQYHLSRPSFGNMRACVMQHCMNERVRRLACPFMNGGENGRHRKWQLSVCVCTMALYARPKGWHTTHWAIDDDDDDIRLESLS